MKSALGLGAIALLGVAGMLRADSVRRISLAWDGQESNGNSACPTISRNGRYAVFCSVASNLVPDDTNGGLDYFVHDLLTGDVRLASLTSTGAQTNETPFAIFVAGSISDDGRYVSFWSGATNIVPGDTNGAEDVFVRDLELGQTVRADVDSNGVEGNAGSTGGLLSPDGTRIVFCSFSSNLVPGDANQTNDVFLRDLVRNQTTCVSVTPAGAPANGDSRGGNITPDNRYVVFYSEASNIVSGDTNGWSDVFLRDLQTNQTERVSLADDGQQGDRSSEGGGWCTPDARFVVFASMARNLVPGDTNNKQDVFVRDRFLGRTSRVSVSTSGVQANANSYSPMISPNGRYIVFEGFATNLVPDDTNARADIFLHDRSTGVTERISVAPGGAQGNLESGFPFLAADLSAPLTIVFHSSASTLVPGDTNGEPDIFLATVDGAAACAGDANGDGVIDLLDLNIVLSEFGQAGPALEGDLNADGACDFLDLNIVLSEFSEVC